MVSIRYTKNGIGVIILYGLLIVSFWGCAAAPIKKCPLPASGQKVWYQNNGDISTCDDFSGFDNPSDVPPGQDGRIAAGCPTESRFEVDGPLVHDTCTDLTWQRVPRNERMTWSEALAFARDLTLGDFDDWRVPNVNELLSLVHYGRNRPALDPVFEFTAEGEIDVRPDDAYWSSTSVDNRSFPTHAWQVIFVHGTHNFVEKSQNLPVRVVRGGFIPRKLPVAPCPGTLSP